MGSSGSSHTPCKIRLVWPARQMQLLIRRCLAASLHPSHPRLHPRESVILECLWSRLPVPLQLLCPLACQREWCAHRTATIPWQRSWTPLLNPNGHGCHVSTNPCTHGRPGSGGALHRPTSTGDASTRCLTLAGHWEAGRRALAIGWSSHCVSTCAFSHAHRIPRCPRN